MKHKKPDDGAYDHGDGCDDVLSRASSLQACECETETQSVLLQSSFSPYAGHS